MSKCLEGKKLISKLAIIVFIVVELSNCVFACWSNIKIFELHISTSNPYSVSSRSQHCEWKWQVNKPTEVFAIIFYTEIKCPT